MSGEDWRVGADCASRIACCAKLKRRIGGAFTAIWDDFGVGAPSSVLRQWHDRAGYGIVKRRVLGRGSRRH